MGKRHTIPCEHQILSSLAPVTMALARAIIIMLLSTLIMSKEGAASRKSRSSQEVEEALTLGNSNESEVGMKPWAKVGRSTGKSKPSTNRKKQNYMEHNPRRKTIKEQ